MVILLHERLTASHIECLELHMVNLFAVGVVFKEGDDDVSEIVAQVLAVFLRRFLKFLRECEFSVRPIFAEHDVFLVTLNTTNFARYHHLLHYGIQQAAQ